MFDRERWLEARRDGIGGSDAAAVVGLNPYKSLYELYLDKIGELPPEEDNEAMRQGRDLEPYVVSRFEEATGKKAYRHRDIIRSKKHPFMLATVDRLIRGEDAGLECKTTSVLNLKRFKNGEFPPEYYVQCMHYLAVTGRARWYLAVLILNQGFKVFEIERDEGEIDALTQAEREFWENHVQKRVPPDPDGSERCGELLKKAFPQAEEGLSVPLFGLEGRLKELCGLKAQIKALERQKAAIEQLIQKELGEAEMGIADGYKVSWKNCTRSSVDLDRLRAAYGDLSGYMKTSTYRKFEVKEL